jgi:hypothetical protein
MDFYRIGAMTVFSELGQLTEEDERLPRKRPRANKIN